MIDYGTQRSTVRPNAVEITETKVFTASDITEISVTDQNEEETEHTEFEFHLVEYDKDEYIRIQAEKNADLEDQLTQTQIAICEVYEMMG